MEQKTRTKLDKIFDNTFHETSYNPDDYVVDLHSEHFVESSESPYGQLQIDNLLSNIDAIISEHFPNFKDASSLKVTRVHKDSINTIYSKVREDLISKHRLIDIWHYLGEYFDIDGKRFFDSLDNKHQNELVTFLKNNTNLINNLSEMDIF